MSGVGKYCFVPIVSFSDIFWSSYHVVNILKLHSLKVLVIWKWANPCYELPLLSSQLCYQASTKACVHKHEITENLWQGSSPAPDFFLFSIINLLFENLIYKYNVFWSNSTPMSYTPAPGGCNQLWDNLHFSCERRGREEAPLRMAWSTLTSYVSHRLNLYIKNHLLRNFIHWLHSFSKYIYLSSLIKWEY